MQTCLKTLSFGPDKKFRLMKDGDIVFVQEFVPSIFDQPEDWSTVWTSTTDWFGEERAVEFMKTLARPTRFALR